MVVLQIWKLLQYLFYSFDVLEYFFDEIQTIVICIANVKCIAKGSAILSNYFVTFKVCKMYCKLAIATSSGIS